MPLKKSLFSLLILTTLTACQPAGKSAVNQVPQQDAIPALSKENVGDFENYSVLSTQDEWKIITWSGKAVRQPGDKIKGENLKHCQRTEKRKASLEGHFAKAVCR